LVLRDEERGMRWGGEEMKGKSVVGLK